jgi:hypothetical protein
VRFPHLSAATREHFKRDGVAKKTYLSKEKADAAAAIHPNMNSYHCRFCGHYHLGNSK